MPETISAQQYRESFASKTEERAHVVKASKRLSEEGLARYACRTMGHYFELPEKSVNFFIRQMELAGKI